MKRLFLLFATVTLLVSVEACKQKPAESTEVTEDTTAVVVPDTAVVPVPAAVGDSRNIMPPPPPNNK